MFSQFLKCLDWTAIFLQTLEDLWRYYQELKKKAKQQYKVNRP